MAICKFCHKPMAWGINGEKYVPLIPLGEEGDVPRSFQDSNGEFRAEHRAVCAGNQGGPTVRVERLAVPIEAENILPRKRGRPKKSKTSGEGAKVSNGVTQCTLDIDLSNLDQTSVHPSSGGV